MIANALVHRSYLEPESVQIALFSDRLEVTSPGGLMRGVTPEKMKEGFSKIRNRALANAFAYMNLIEKWGSGFPRIFRNCRDYGLKEPEIIDFEGDLRVNLYRTTDQTPKTDQITNQTDQTQKGENHMELQDVSERSALPAAKAGRMALTKTTGYVRIVLVS